MPNCLADNTTGHLCDPYVLLRDLYVCICFYIANILVKRVPGSIQVTTSSLAHPNSIATRPPQWHIFIIFSIIVPGSGRF